MEWWWGKVNDLLVNVPKVTLHCLCHGTQESETDSKLLKNKLKPLLLLLIGGLLPGGGGIPKKILETLTSLQGTSIKNKAV